MFSIHYICFVRSWYNTNGTFVSSYAKRPQFLTAINRMFRMVLNRIGCVRISVLASSVVDRVGSCPGRVKPKTVKCVFTLFFHWAHILKSKSKDWLAHNQDNVYEWSDIFTRGLLFQWASTIKIQLRCLSSTKPTSSS